MASEREATDEAAPAVQQPALRRGRGKPKRAEVAVVTALHAHAAWLVARVGRYPKDIKYTLGHRTVGLVVELIETCVEAAWLPAGERRVVLAASC